MHPLLTSALHAARAALASLDRTPTVGALLTLYRASLTCPNTLKRFASHARCHFPPIADVPADQMDRARVLAWLDGLRRTRKLTHPSLLVCWKALRAVVRFGVEHRALASVPWGEWHPRLAPSVRVPRECCRSVDELLRLVAAAHAIDAERRAQGQYSDAAARVATCAVLGLRNGELAALAWDDFRASADGVIVKIERQAVDGWRARHPEWTRPRDPVKQRAGAELLVPPELVAVLDAHRAMLTMLGRFAPDGPVFPSHLTFAWRETSDAISKDLVRLCAKRAGLAPGRWSPHSLRDSCATLEAFATGGDLRAVQARTRHASLHSLLTYLHASTRGRVPSRVQLPDLQHAPELASDAKDRTEWGPRNRRSSRFTRSGTPRATSGRARAS